MARWTHKPFSPFTKGDKVWLEARNLKQQITNLKFALKQEGPFTIIKVLSPIMYELKIPKTWKIHPVFHTSLLSPYDENPIHGPNFPKPPPDLNEGKEEYEIEKILCHHGPPSNRSFLIRWKGFSTEDNSWEPERNVKHSKSALTKYRKRHPSTFPSELSSPLPIMTIKLSSPTFPLLNTLLPSCSVSSSSLLEPSSVIESVTHPPTPHPNAIFTPTVEDDLPPTSIASTPSEDLHPGILSIDIPTYANFPLNLT